MIYYISAVRNDWLSW